MIALSPKVAKKGLARPDTANIYQALRSPNGVF
jgi:hypothetical protein